MPLHREQEKLRDCFLFAKVETFPNGEWCVTKSGEGYFMKPCILEVSQYPPKTCNLFIFDLDWLEESTDIHCE